MAKIYTKGTWVDEVLAGDEKYTIKEAGVSTHADAVIALKTEVVTPGTAVNASRMNNIEEGIDALDTKLNSAGADIIKETSASLAVGSVVDGSILVRSGTSLVGKTVAEMQVVLNPNSLINGVWHKQLWIGGWKPKLTSGCGDQEQLELATNKNVVDYCPFDKDTIEYAYANVALPQDYAGGVIYAKPYWLHPAATAFKVSWGLQGVAVSNDDALDIAQGTAVYSNDEGGTTNDLYVGPLTAAITIAGNPAAGDLVQFVASRKADDTTNDTLNVDGYLLGWMIWYPVK